MRGKLIYWLHSVPIPLMTDNNKHRIGEFALREHEAAVLADHLIANGVTVQQWIPVTERFPEKCVDYLCLCVLTDDNHVKPFCMVLRYIRDNEPHFQYELNGSIKVTHWMPLPEPPKEGV